MMLAGDLSARATADGRKSKLCPDGAPAAAAVVQHQPLTGHLKFKSWLSPVNHAAQHSSAQRIKARVAPPE
jgi:hypothetical protein